MSLKNTGFEDAGTLAGDADQWVTTVVSSLEEFADFARNPSVTDTRAQERFEEGWTSPDDQVFVAEYEGFTIDLERAVFDPPSGPAQPEEDFESGWGLVLLSLSGIRFADFDSTLQAFEDFEEEWGDLVPVFEDVNLSAAVFGAPPRDATFDPFETDWQGNTGKPLALVDVNTESATFVEDDQFTLVENFEAVREDVQVATVDDTLDTLSFGFDLPFFIELFERVSLRNDGGTLPTPLEEDVLYFVGATGGVTGTNLIGLKTQVTAPLIDLDNQGTGSHFVVFDPARFWIAPMTTL